MANVFAKQPGVHMRRSEVSRCRPRTRLQGTEQYRRGPGTSSNCMLYITSDDTSNRIMVCLQLAPPAYREVVFLVDHISKTRVHACTARRTGSKSAAAAAASCQQACLPACQMEAIPSNSCSYRNSCAAQHLHEKQHVLCPRALPHVRSGAESCFSIDRR